MSKTDNPWPVWKLAVVFYPFVAATAAINLFLLGLIFSFVDWPGIAPMQAIVWSIPLGVPLTWWAGHWVRGLMDEAEG